LARGYLGRAELTAEKFIAHPFSGVGGERLYRSGDLVRRQGNGELEFLGRLDEQVKVRGYRVELGEVESVLRQHPQVREVVVVVRAVGANEKQLVAYVVGTESNGEQLGQELRGYLKERLPEYMVPGLFVVLAELPLTQSGKVDRRALPAPDAIAPDPEELVTPRNELEASLAEIWLDVLRLKRLSVHSNFFDLGGHSLLATQVISRVLEVLHIELPLRTIFEAPTIATFAEAIEKAKREKTEISVPPIVPVSRESYRLKVSKQAVTDRDP
jgi:acyl carrier protein